MIDLLISGSGIFDISKATPKQVDIVYHFRSRLELVQKGFAGENPVLFPFSRGDPTKWFLVPRGWLLSKDGRECMEALSREGPLNIKDYRGIVAPTQRFSKSYRFKDSIRFGVPPFNPKQPKFIRDVVDASVSNRHGGLGVAGVRSGKTLMSLAASLEFGYKTLVIVDSSVIFNQWLGAINQIEDEFGNPPSHGVIREDRFELADFTVAMAQTLHRRKLNISHVSWFGTLLLDECQTAPADSFAEAVVQFNTQYFIGLSGTPDKRKDGLVQAVWWITGPPIAYLDNPVNAQVTQVMIPYDKRTRYKSTEEDGTVKERNLPFARMGQFDIVNAEKMLMSDPRRVDIITDIAISEAEQKNRTIVAVGLRDHAHTLLQSVRRKGYEAGLLLGGTNDPRKIMADFDILISTEKFIGKGADVQPCCNRMIIASPFGDVSQLCGRILNPQVTGIPKVYDVVDGHPSCEKRGGQRLEFYTRKGFVVLAPTPVVVGSL